MAGELARRTATALALGGTALAATWAGGLWTLGFALALFAAHAWELAGMTTADAKPRDRAISAALSSAVALFGVARLAGVDLGDFGQVVLILAFAAYVAGMAAAFDRGRRSSAEAAAAGTSPPPRPRSSWLLPGAIALTMAWCFPAATSVVVLREAYGFEALAWPVLVVIASDVGAMFAGRALGGPKLSPALSPNKTWSGFAGGLAAGVAAGAAVALGFGWSLTPAVLAVALAVVIAGVAGDLAESALKRRAGVKDSGGLLPGHGGVFDRFDSHLFALPVFALIVHAFGWPL